MKALSLSAIGLFALLSLAPPTDADSLGYHIGLPLHVLSGQSPYVPAWLATRLIGLGEFINVAFLSMGTENFLSLASVVVLAGTVALISQRAPDGRSALLATTAIIALPILLFLTTSQKPQLLPSCALIYASLVLLDWKKTQQLDKFFGRL